MDENRLQELRNLWPEEMIDDRLWFWCEKGQFLNTIEKSKFATKKFNNDLEQLTNKVNDFLSIFNPDNPLMHIIYNLSYEYGVKVNELPNIPDLKKELECVSQVSNSLLNGCLNNQYPKYAAIRNHALSQLASEFIYFYDYKVDDARLTAAKTFLLFGVDVPGMSEDVDPIDRRRILQGIMPNIKEWMG